MYPHQVLFIGGTGTMGRYLLHGLVSSGIKVKALTRNATRAQSIVASTHLQWIQGDIQKVRDLEQVLDGIDSLIINLNSLEQVGDKLWQPLHQGLGTLLVFARMHQVRHIIFHSMEASYRIPEAHVILKLPYLQQLAERFVSTSEWHIIHQFPNFAVCWKIFTAGFIPAINFGFLN